MTKTPCFLVGDGPQEQTGLGRIARDIGALLTTTELFDLVQIGGPIPPVWAGWHHLPMAEAARGDDWGASYVAALWHDVFGRQPGVLFCIWDPARLYPYAALDLPVRKWAYVAIDSYNRWGGLSGPPAVALQGFDRVLAYTRWGSEIIRNLSTPPVAYLPHGLWLANFGPLADSDYAWVAEQLGPHVGREAIVIGCVATNQARKDLSLFCETLATLRGRGLNVYGWLHTDELVRAWSVTQLVEDCGLDHAITVTIGHYTDRQLACLYHRADVTIAPGLGEGFGYPIVESLAAGTPVIHGDFGGGAELVPKAEWRVPIAATRRESIYALTRPVFRPEDVANAVERALAWRATVGARTADAYCRGAVAHLDWLQLRPRWESWIRGGLA